MSLTRPNGDIQFGVYERHEYGDFAIFVRIVDAAGERTFLAKPVEFGPVDESVRHPPMIELDHRAAQQLMDSLWACGLRPKNGEGNAGQLGATERHLDDMRKLAFAKIGVEP